MIKKEAAHVPEIELNNITKTFPSRDGGEFLALDKVDLKIEKNEFVCIVGPSGCGKSTVMNIIAGLLEPSTGSLLLNGEKVHGPGKGRGVVFQEYALYPWLTSIKNVEFGLKIQGISKKKRRKIAEKYLSLVGLDSFAHAYPKELSGGMKQRVALARSYATNPDVLLMDEPFGALDAQTRAQLQENLLKTWQTEKKTCFFITHDVEEAVLLSTKIIIMSAGPGRIKEVIDNTLSYPRTQKTKLNEDFNNLKNDIWGRVYKEYLQNNK